MSNPIVPGGVTDSNTTKTAKEIAAEQAAKAAKEAEEAAKAEEERKKAEEEAKRKAEEEAAKTATQKTETETETSTKIVLTTDDGDVEYDLDADGNAVKDGEIVYTKAQLDEFAAAETQEETIDVSAISAISGLTPVNVDGTPKQYEMTVEGLAQRDADIAELAKRQAESESTISSVLIRIFIKLLFTNKRMVLLKVLLIMLIGLQ